MSSSYVMTAIQKSQSGGHSIAMVCNLLVSINNKIISSCSVCSSRKKCDIYFDILLFNGDTISFHRSAMSHDYYIKHLQNMSLVNMYDMLIELNSYFFIDEGINYQIEYVTRHIYNQIIKNEKEDINSL